MASAYEPTPPLGPPTLMEKLYAFAVLPLLPWTWLRVLFRRAFGITNNLSLKADLVCSTARLVFPYISLSIKRGRIRNAENKFAVSKRFASTRTELYEKDFTGYWICKGCPGKPTALSDVDLVLFYIHGGAYQVGHACAGIAPYLRIAELADKKGKSIAVFSLDYTLTPEGQFPTQANQAIAAYRYLLNEQHIDPTKLAIIGESAGAHLVLCFLAVLADEGSLPKPEAGAFVIAPWIDLRCSNGSYRRNRDRDYLSREWLLEAGYQFMPRELEATSSHIINFSLPRPGKQTWADILPSKVWVAIGSNEIFLDDAVTFVNRAKADGVNINFQIDEGKTHAWWTVEDSFDIDEYFDTVGELREGLMAGAAGITEGIFSTLAW